MRRVQILIYPLAIFNMVISNSVYGEKNFPFENFVGHKHDRMFSCQ